MTSRAAGYFEWRDALANARGVSLTPAQVAPMFEAFKATKGIVFDMRGYPQGTAWAIAPRLNTRKAPYAAMFHRRFVDPATVSYTHLTLPTSDLV